MILSRLNIKWYDAFFLSMLAISAIVVSINWDRYCVCTYPLRIWIAVNYAAIFAFRILMFVDNGLALGLRTYLDLSMKAITSVPKHQKEFVRRFVDVRFDYAIGEKSWKEKLSKAFRVNKQNVCKGFLEKKEKPNWLHTEIWERIKSLVHSEEFKVTDGVKSSSIATTSMSTPNSFDKVLILMVGQRVRILEIDIKRTAGLGTLLSLDPNFTVDTIPIGVGFVEVRVEEAFVRNALLFNSSEETQFLSDTMGLNVA